MKSFDNDNDDAANEKEAQLSPSVSEATQLSSTEIPVDSPKASPQDEENQTARQQPNAVRGDSNAVEGGSSPGSAPGAYRFGAVEDDVVVADMDGDAGSHANAASLSRDQQPSSEGASLTGVHLQGMAVAEPLSSDALEQSVGHHPPQGKADSVSNGKRRKRTLICAALAIILTAAAVTIAVLLTRNDKPKWSLLGSIIQGEAASDNSGHLVTLSADGTILAISATYNDAEDLLDAGHVRVYAFDGNDWSKLGNDIDGSAPGDRSGYSLSMSEDGRTIATGARFNDQGGDSSGHARVFTYNEVSDSWDQLGDDLIGEAAGDRFGRSVSLSSDGRTVAVGGVLNDGSSTDPDYDNGHVRVFEYNEGVGNWDQLGGDIDGEAAGDRSGQAVALSADGRILAVGAHKNDAAGKNSGHVRVYRFSSLGQWEQLGEDIDGEAEGDAFGNQVSLTADGMTLVVGAYAHDGVGEDSGHVIFYQYSDESNWTKVGSIDGDKPGDFFGESVDVTPDGKMLAVGAIWSDPGGDKSGHARVYEKSDGQWIQVGQDLNGEAEGDESGGSVSLSRDGKRLAVGTPKRTGSFQDNGEVRVYELV